MCNISIHCIDRKLQGERRVRLEKKQTHLIVKCRLINSCCNHEASWLDLYGRRHCQSLGHISISQLGWVVDVYLSTACIGQLESLIYFFIALITKRQLVRSSRPTKVVDKTREGVDPNMEDPYLIVIAALAAVIGLIRC